VSLPPKDLIQAYVLVAQGEDIAQVLEQIVLRHIIGTVESAVHHRTEVDPRLWPLRAVSQANNWLYDHSTWLGLTI
jgi:hypothetical protein